jgi:hypothetical protein
VNWNCIAAETRVTYMIHGTVSHDHLIVLFSSQ